MGHTAGGVGGRAIEKGGGRLPSPAAPIQGVSHALTYPSHTMRKFGGFQPRTRKSVFPGDGLMPGSNDSCEDFFPGKFYGRRRARIMAWQQSRAV